jgi:hypothetical protein
MPQFDLMCFEISIFSTLLTFLLFYRINVLTLLPNFVESFKLRFKKSQYNKVLAESLKVQTRIDRNLFLRQYLA